MLSNHAEDELRQMPSWQVPSRCVRRQMSLWQRLLRRIFG